jgi:hypothetical protein
MSQSENRFYYVTGSKGGVGKSLVANALVFNLMEKGKRVKIIDTDDSNPDVGVIYENLVPVKYVPLTDDSISWGKFLNTLSELAAQTEEDTSVNVVVNGAARDNKSIEANGELLNDVFREGLNFEFTTIWVMSNTIESVQLLQSYLKAVRVGTVFALRNLHFGLPDEFIEFNEIAESIKDRVAGVFDFPAMESLLASHIHRGKTLFSDAEKSLPIGSRMLLKRWLNRVRELFSKMDTQITLIKNIRDQVSASAEQTGNA